MSAAKNILKDIKQVFINIWFPQYHQYYPYIINISVNIVILTVNIDCILPVTTLAAVQIVDISVTSSLIGPNVLLSSLFANNLNLFDK